jgi:YaiO family outer membrane protein
MRRQALILFTFIFISGFACSWNIYAQENINPETEYQRIRTMAFSGDYTGAATAARKLLKACPSYGDARILLGRILAWQKDYKQAAAVIDTLLQTEPGNADALAAKRDISLWSKENTPVSTDIRAGYYFDYFRKPFDRFWQVLRAGAGHKFDWGPAAAYVNVGNISIGDPSPAHATELQFEAEAYPQISNKNYAFLSYAYSPGSYFPRHRAAVQVWQVLPAGFAVSAGMNYYYFDKSYYIALVSLEKYVKKFWFSGRCFVYFKDKGPTTSFYVDARRYFNDVNYLQLTLGTGTAPDEPFNIESEITRLTANSVRLTLNTLITSKLTLRVGTGYSREKYPPEALMRDRFEGNIMLIYALKMK